MSLQPSRRARNLININGYLASTVLNTTTQAAIASLVTTNGLIPVAKSLDVPVGRLFKYLYATCSKGDRMVIQMMWTTYVGQPGGQPGIIDTIINAPFDSWMSLKVHGGVQTAKMNLVEQISGPPTDAVTTTHTYTGRNNTENVGKPTDVNSWGKTGP